MEFKDRTGEVNYNKYGSKMTIKKYYGYKDILVEFDNGYMAHSRYLRFKTGDIKSPYDKSLINIGYLGVGEFSVASGKILTQEYNAWSNMINRCYNPKVHKKRPTYIDCSVHPEWHNFQNFARWYNENLCDAQGEKIEIDKDILIKGNKVYGPGTCCLAPTRINLMFVKKDFNRGILPIGVCNITNSKKFSAYCDSIYLGKYLTPEEAFNAYKKQKKLI